MGLSRRRELGRELAGLLRSVASRPRWQLIAAMIISTWTLAWILSQIAAETTPLGVIRNLLRWVGASTPDWLDKATDWCRHPMRRGFLMAMALLVGPVWAATTERSQLPALLGWLMVMAAGEGLGYRPAVHRAVLALAVFITVLFVWALPNRRRMVDRQMLLLPKDVLRAGTTAAALSAIIPILTPVVILVRILQPYLTQPPERTQWRSSDRTRRSVPEDVSIDIQLPPQARPAELGGEQHPTNGPHHTAR